MEKVVGGSRFGEMIKIFEEIALVLVYSSHVNFKSECSSGTLLNCFPIVSKQPGSLEARQERSERHCVTECQCVRVLTLAECDWLVCKVCAGKGMKIGKESHVPFV